MTNQLSLAAMLALSLTFVGCSKAPETTQTLHQAVAIEQADECHLCGMLIKEFGGPKGEVFEKEQREVKKFCSTRDMFSYYLQPENKRQASQIFVHDMSQVPWGQPDDKIFIDAKTAWFVKGSSKKGAMGSTLASFKLKATADEFAKEFGGKVVGFDEVTLGLLME